MKLKKIIKLVATITILAFLFSYAIEKSGYYEYNLQNKKNLTEEEIEQFEKDVKAGKDIDINEYLKDNTIDYSNNLTKTTSEMSIKLNKYLKKFLTNSFDIFGKLLK